MLNSPDLKVKQIKLGDILTVSSGGTPSRKIDEYFVDGNIAWVKTGDLKGKFVNASTEYISKLGLDNSSAKLFPPKTVLLAMYGATIGACSILQFEAATNQACAAILPSDVCNEVFLYYYFLFIKPSLINKGVGGAQPNISAGLIKNLEIPLPPLPEQQKIASILDVADSLRQKDQQLIEKYTALSQSLFLEMFGDPLANPNKWPIISLGNIIEEGPQNGLYKPSSDYGTGTPIIRIDSFHNRVVELDKLKRVRVNDSELNKFEIFEGDFVINRVNSPSHLGKCGFVLEVKERMVFESNMMRIKFNNSMVNNAFMLLILSSQHVKRQILNSAKDAVNQSSIKSHLRCNAFQIHGRKRSGISASFIYRFTLYAILGFIKS